MDDTISRQAAIEALTALEEPAPTARHLSAIYDCEDAIKALPSAQPEQRWIPCSERLPKKEEATYLICTEAGYMCSCRWTNNMYGLGSNEWSKWGWHIMDKPQYAKVVAWMPLKPWKGADDE